MTMTNLLQKLQSVGVGFLTAIALFSYRRTIINDNKVRSIDRLFDETVANYKEANQRLNNIQDLLLSNSQKVESQLVSVTEHLESLAQDVTNLNNAVNNGSSNNALIDATLKSVKISNGKALTELNSLMNDINSHKLISNFTDNINNFVDNFNNYLSSLSSIELGAVAHTLASFTILLCLLSILSAYYGDRLIRYFNLEVRFPKLAKIIQLRRTFQDYYIAYNAIWIIFILFFVIYTNVSILYHIS
uniref:hypothetical protein n=1 Tax=Leucopaxillus giganteus TaxID=1167592 RepID=UPI00315CABF2